MSNIVISNKSIENYIDYDNFDIGTSTGTFADDLTQRTRNSGIPSWVFPLFRDYLKLNYYGMLYTLIPLTVTDDENSEKYYMHNISKIICRTFLRNKIILSNIDEETKTLTGLSFEKVIDTDNKKRGTDGHVITGSDDTTNKAMTETSPITSGNNEDGTPNYTIVTPSGRTLGNSFNTSSKNDTITYNSDVTEKLKETNPYYYDMFIRTIEKYNLYNIYDNAIRSVIKEFIEVF